MNFLQQNTEEEAKKKTAVQQPNLWEHLEQMFKLNQNHKGEEIYIEIKEEALIITTESGGEYITEKRMLPERSWENLLEWREESCY
ncbi:hypothetical protein CAJAP_03369 [Camponotus japonicus]